MTVKERISKLQELMKGSNIDIYLVPTDDFHHSEIVGDYFKARAYMTGFTGSAGVAVFTQESAGLWTDARYFIQAGLELADTGVQLHKIGEAGVSTVPEYIKQELKEGGTLGFDGRTVGVKDGLEFKKIAEEKSGHVVMDLDLVDKIWEDRPGLSTAPVFVLEEKYTGESVAKKLEEVRAHMDKVGANIFLITTLDDICWLLNIRGEDIPFVPFVLSYVAIRKDKVTLYTNKEKFSSEIIHDFNQLNISIEDYNGIYEDVKNLLKDDVVLLDPQGVNITLYSNLPNEVKVIKEMNPVILMKNIKNQVEIENIRKAQLKDSVVKTKLMYWLKHHPNIREEDELSVARKLESLRSEQELFIGASFPPICAYKEHGAICHYSATEESNKSLEGEGLLITDSGGHYLEGSTDITRTNVIGKATKEEKKYYTTVAMSNLKLSDFKFVYGCTGHHLDVVAREPFWRQGVDYKHGTGHGIGHVGGIHEPPNAIHWVKRAYEPVVLEEYMVFSNEPGYYQEGAFGIRLENNVVVRKGEENEYGQFMYLETLTFAPFDLDGIDVELMTKQERELLNNYHKEVAKKIGPLLTEEERDWLRTATREV